MFVSAQLCDAQGAVLFPFVHLPPRVRRPFAGAPVYDLLRFLTHGERLRVVACGLTGRLVCLLSGCCFEPDRNFNRRACHKLMHLQVGRVAVKLMHSLAAAVGSKVGKEATELCESGQCAAAADALKRAIDVRHLPSRALLAHMMMMMDGREGVAVDRPEALALVEEGRRLGCHHCQGVLAWGCMWGYSHIYPRDRLENAFRVSRVLEFVLESAGKGSRYGQCNLGAHYENTRNPYYYVQAVAWYRLAAAQNLDSAQLRLGHMHCNGFGVAEDFTEMLRLYQLAAAQGHPQALYEVAACHEKGKGVILNRYEAIRWYRRAQAAGHDDAERALRRLALLPARVRISTGGKPAPRP